MHNTPSLKDKNLLGGMVATRKNGEEDLIGSKGITDASSCSYISS
jgi:hypothetical protein